MTRRAVLYLRLSESSDDSTSIVRQEADLRLRAEREGAEVTEVLVDDGLSGGYSRAKSDRALDLIRSGGADLLLVWKFDRWSRQGLGAVAALIEALDANPKAVFIADRDGLVSTQPAWRIIAAVLAEVARMERENTKARVLSSLAHLRTSGRYAGGQRPYGYVSADNPAGPGRILVVDPAEAAIVREAASRVLSGETPYAVAHDLNARGIPSKSGKRWSAYVLRTLLQADALVGRVTHRGELVRDADGLPAEVWEPVLDLDSWHRLRALLSRDKTSGAPEPRRRRARLLSGLLACAHCGSAMYVRTDGKGIASYNCQAKADGYRECVGVAVAADRIEAHVTDLFLSQVGHLEVMERVEEDLDDAALADVERAISETAAAMADDDADVVALASRLSTLKARRAELRDRPAERKVSIVPTGETFAQAWDRGSLAERQAILGANVALLTVSKGRRGHHGLDTSRVNFIAQPAALEVGLWRTPEPEDT